MSELSDDLMYRLTSRKFLMAIGSILIAVGGYMHGDFDAAQTITSVTTAALGYLAAEAAVDATRAVSQPQTAPEARARAQDPVGPTVTITPEAAEAMERASQAQALRTVRQRTNKPAPTRRRVIQAQAVPVGDVGRLGR